VTSAQRLAKPYRLDESGDWGNLPRRGNPSPIVLRSPRPRAESPTPALSNIRLYYRTAPGAGSFKIQTAPMVGDYPGTFSDLPGYTNISADGASGMSVLTAPVAGGGENLAWRLVGV